LHTGYDVIVMYPLYGAPYMKKTIECIGLLSLNLWILRQINFMLFYRCYQEYSTCVSTVIGDCSQVTQVIFQGINDAWSYLCGNSTGMSWFFTNIYIYIYIYTCCTFELYYLTWLVQSVSRDDKHFQMSPPIARSIVYWKFALKLVSALLKSDVMCPRR